MDLPPTPATTDTAPATDTVPNRLLLVDASSYLYRAFHALPDMRSPAGEPSGALYGVISMLARLRQQYPSRYLACVFDPPGKTFRDTIYPEYKATRSAMPEDMAVQIPPLFDAIRGLGWPLIAVPGYEADDVIGTLSVKATAAGITTLMSTGDKDLTQLINDHVLWFNSMSMETLDAAGVKEKFGVLPDRIIDYLTLVGDSVDNVPGVDKCGPKTAAKWLNEYGSLDNVVANADSIKGVVGENLRKAIPWLPTGRLLVTVKTDVELDFELAALTPRAEDVEALDAIYQRFSFRSLRAALHKDRPTGEATGLDGVLQSAKREATIARSVQAANAVAAAPKPATTFVATRNYETVTSEGALSRWIDKLKAAPLACFDTETTSLSPMTAQLVGLAFSVTPGEACYIPLTHRYAGVEEQLPLATVLAALKPWFEDPTRAKLAQNAKYDCHVLANHGIAVLGLTDDSLLESYVLESHMRHDMDSLATRHLGMTPIAYESVAGRGAQQIPFDQVSIGEATRYSAEDADVTLQLHQALAPQIASDPKLATIYRTVEMPVTKVLLTIERNGVLLDTAALDAQSHELGKKALELEAKAHELAGQPFNLGSPKQLAEIFFDRMKLPVIKKTATGTPSTDEEVLEQLANDYPLPKVILEHRSLIKLKSTYTDKLPRMVNPATGRVHTTYAQAVAVTGRLASNDPNLQNIPVRTAEGRRIREAFIAPPRSVIMSCDYSQIELRIMAHVSGDRGLLEAFARGDDIHRATAAEVFGVTQDAVTQEQRRYAKVINFGLIYGMGAFGLAGNLGITKSAAKSYIDRYFARYPGVAQYMQDTRSSAHDLGYVETVFGRRLWLPDINSRNMARRQGAERQAINAPMQGTAADLIKLAMVAVQGFLEREHLATRLVMQVHDELVLEVPEAELTRVKSEVPALMTGVAQLKVPLLAEPGIGKNWDEAH
jgi:DNA polymerase I